MKIFEKFVLILYSFIVLIISVISCLIIFKIINANNINDFIKFILEDSAISILVVAVSIICMLTSIKCLFFRKKKEIKKSNTTDILLENESGRLLISKKAIENAVKNIISDIMTFNPETKVIVDIDPANNISIYISIFIDKNVKVRDLTLGLQIKIKDTIKENFDLDVKQVNIKIDSIEKDATKKENVKKEINKKEPDKKEINNESNNKIIEIENNTSN